MRLRPHHLIDIASDFEPLSQAEDGAGREPVSGENGVGMLTRALPGSMDCEVELVVGPDDICRPCRHLRPDGTCERVLERHIPAQPMDEYNDELDMRLLAYLGIAPGATMSIREFLGAVAERTPGIEAVCTHPTEDRSSRLESLVRGLARLGFTALG